MMSADIKDVERDDVDADDLSYTGDDDAYTPSTSTGHGKKRKKIKRKSSDLQGIDLIKKKVCSKKMVDTSMCIICQENKKKAPIGTAQGRNTLFQCARNKDDEVYERIISTDSEKTFLYHSGNLCYKPYILVKPDPKQTTVEGIDDDDDASTETEFCSWERKLRFPDTLREAASPKRNPSDMKCVICNQVTKN